MVSPGALLISVVGGLFIASFFRITSGPQAVLFLFVLIMVAVLIAAFWSQKRFALIVLAFLCALIFGIVREGADTIRQSTQGKDNNLTRDALIRGTVAFMGNATPDAASFFLRVEKIDERKQHPESLVYVSGATLGQTIYAGDEVTLRCSWRAVDRVAQSGFAAYVREHNAVATCYAPIVQKISLHRNALAVLNAVLVERLGSNLVPPYSSVMRAMFFGNAFLDKSFFTQLNAIGVSHLIAISGMNFSMLGGMFFYLFILGGLWRREAFLASAAILLVYVLMLGPMPSAWRAFLSFIILGYALASGRYSAGLRILVVVGGLLIIYHPAYSTDIGFLLSFGSTAGILLFKEFFDDLGRHLRMPAGIRDMLSITLAAEVCTIPLLFYAFGYFSAISIIANILLVPIFPLIMGVGILLIVFGGGWLGVLAGIGAHILMTYFITVVELLNRIPLTIHYAANEVFLVGYFSLLAMAVSVARWRSRRSAAVRGIA
jgi:ComEC/Rec2-related protein